MGLMGKAIDLQDGKAAGDLVQRLIGLGIEGNAPGLKSSVELAEEYRRKSSFADDEARIDAIIRQHVAMAGGTGFATGLGGLATLPVTLPAGLTSAWVIQARMIGAIAYLRGHDLADEDVRLLSMAALVGDGMVNEVVKEIAKDAGQKAAKAAVMKLPGHVVLRINKLVGFRLLTKAGQTGTINLIKVVPIAGGVAGGAVDALATRTVGAVAKRAFPPNVRSSAEVIDVEAIDVEEVVVARPQPSLQLH